MNHSGTLSTSALRVQLENSPGSDSDGARLDPGRLVGHRDVWCHVAGKRPHHKIVREDLIRGRYKRARIFRPKPPSPHLPPLFLEECRSYLGVPLRRGPDPLPLGAAVLARFEEVASSAEWCGHEDESGPGPGSMDGQRDMEPSARSIAPGRTGTISASTTSITYSIPETCRPLHAVLSETAVLVANTCCFSKKGKDFSFIKAIYLIMEIFY